MKVPKYDDINISDDNDPIVVECFQGWKMNKLRPFFTPQAFGRLDSGLKFSTWTVSFALRGFAAKKGKTPSYKYQHYHLNHPTPDKFKLSFQAKFKLLNGDSRVIYHHLHIHHDMRAPSAKLEDCNQNVSIYVYTVYSLRKLYLGKYNQQKRNVQERNVPLSHNFTRI